MWARCAPYGLAFAAVLLSAPARASANYRLALRSEPDTEGCVVATELSTAVINRLGYDPFQETAPALVSVRLSRRRTELRASVELVDESGLPHGQRELSTASQACAEMTRAIALSISIAIDPERAGAEPQPAPPPPPTDLLPVLPDPAPAPAVAKSLPVSPPVLGPSPGRDQLRKPSPRGRFVSGAVRAVAMFGVAPLPAFGAALDAQVQREQWSWSVGARVLRALEGDVAAAARLQVTLAAAELAGCWRRGAAELCGLGLLGGSWARASGVDHPRTDVGPFVALGGRLGLIAPLSDSLALLLQGEVAGVLAPIWPEVDGQTVWKAPVWTAGVASGVRARFW